MIPGVNTTDGKVSIASVNGAGGSRAFWDTSGDFREQNTLRKYLGSEEHLDWLKIDLNVAEIYTVQDYKHKKLMWMEVHIYNVKAKSQAGNVWIKDIMTT